MADLFAPPTWPLSGGSLPQMQGAFNGLFQPLTFGVVTKTAKGFQVSETMETINFRGVVQPLSDSKLLIKPEGQRTWSWWQCHAERDLKLKNDDVVIYLGKPTRVMSFKDYSAYGYVEYQLVQDWTGAGPIVVTP